MKYLPPEIWRLIYEYDDTYYTKYKEVMKDLKNVFFKYNWYVHHAMYSNDLNMHNRDVTNDLRLNSYHLEYFDIFHFAKQRRKNSCKTI